LRCLSLSDSDKNFKTQKMGDKFKFFDFAYEPQNCWTFKDFNELYFGSNYNTSGVLRFTSLIYVSIYFCFKRLKFEKFSERWKLF
jgi:hypothetical protein